MKITENLYEEKYNYVQSRVKLHFNEAKEKYLNMKGNNGLRKGYCLTEKVIAETQLLTWWRILGFFEKNINIEKILY